MTKPNLTKKQILLVEDEPAIAAATRMMLRIEGHSVAVAQDGLSGLERFRQSRFDLVITDYKMPRMAGDELAANIKQLAPRQPILMVSAVAAELGGRPPGVDLLLAKPFTSEVLRNAVADLLATPAGTDDVADPCREQLAGEPPTAIVT